MRLVYLLFAFCISGVLHAQDIFTIEQDSALNTIDVNDNFTGDFKIPILYNMDTPAEYGWTLSWEAPEEWQSQLCINPKKCYGFDETDAVLEFESGIDFEYALKIFHNDVCGEGTYTFRLLNADGEVDEEFTNILTAINCGVTNTIDTEIKSWSIAPNPTSDLFTISNYEQFTSMKIYNISGRLIKDLEIKAHHDASELVNGVYLIQVINEQGFTETKRLIKR